MSDGGKVVSADRPGGIRESSGGPRGDHSGICLSLEFQGPFSLLY